jgi:hypothetical protein
MAAVAYHIKDIETVITGSQNQGKGDLTISRRMYCEPYTGIVSLMSDLFGGYRKLGKTILLIPPLRHPLFPWTRCTGIQIAPFEKMGYIPASSTTGIRGLARIPVPVNPVTGAVGKAEVTATYTLPTLPEDQADSNGGDADQQMDIASESWDFGSQRLTLLNEFYKWEINGPPKRPQDFQVTKTLAESRVQLTRHKCLTIPITTVSRLTDTINKSAFRIVNSVIPAYCCRFDGMSAARRLTTGQGLIFYEITYKFSLRLIYDYTEDAPTTRSYVGWNRIFNPEKGYWERLINYPTYAAGPRGIYTLDEDIYPPSTQPNAKPIKGLQYLFSPRAV